MSKRGYARAVLPSDYVNRRATPELLEAMRYDRRMLLEAAAEEGVPLEEAVDLRLRAGQLQDMLEMARRCPTCGKG